MQHTTKHCHDFSNCFDTGAITEAILVGKQVQVNCSVLDCVAVTVCCHVLQFDEVCCDVLRCETQVELLFLSVDVSRIVLQFQCVAVYCIAVCCDVLRSVLLRCCVLDGLQCIAVYSTVLRLVSVCGTVCFSMWHCMAVCCGAWQCVAMRCGVLHCLIAQPRTAYFVLLQ